MNTSPNLDLPYIMPNQAQKHVTHNEAIRALDALVQVSVETRGLTEPPPDVEDGARYIPAAGASGDWDSADHHIAAYQDGAWVFYTPADGWLAWVEDEALLLVYEGTAWREALDKVLSLGVNASADATNRLAVKSPASLFDHGGAGHQMKLNKAGALNTASVLFQSGYSGRAEVGLVGSDNLDFKVSPDGATFETALRLKADTGHVGVGTDAPTTRLHVSQGNATLVKVEASDLAGAAGYEIDLSGEAQVWRMTGQSELFKIRDHSASIDKFVIDSGASGGARFAAAVRIGQYGKAALPSASSAGAGAIAYVSDEAGGATLAFSDGVSWRRVQDRAVVS